MLEQVINNQSSKHPKHVIANNQTLDSIIWIMRVT